MSDFKAKMHQIRFRLALRPRPRWGSLQRSPDPPAGFKGAYFNEPGLTSKGREGRKDVREGQGRGRREGRGGEGVANFFFPGAICHRLRVLRCDWLPDDLIHAVNNNASQRVHSNGRFSAAH